jgi:hypothetical protein
VSEPIRRAALLLALIAALLVAYQKLDTNATMASAATNLLNSLTSEQKQKINFMFEDEQRFDWHFIPRDRKGLPYKEMTPAQRHLADALLSAGLTQQGFQKAVTIMSLEDILKEIEKDTPPGRRDAEKYYFSIFGTPAEKGTWGYRVEGHHLSLNFTVVDGGATAVPTFFGTNPAEVRTGPRAGLRVLRQEEDTAREFVKSLTPAQQKEAIVSDKAPDDIFTMASRKAALSGQPNGLAVARLTAAQRTLFDKILQAYIGNFPDTIAEKRQRQVKEAGQKLYFAWAGSTEKGQRHYYRIQAPAFLVEYDNTQNEANHIHAVWRDYEGDFGLDLLGAHYKASHLNK